ncbi:MAG: hypothetical protein PQJ60_01315 [Spirochaetales bacterium]|nr:hypothetical protein [Spirochaetales bacterium]
MYRVLGTTLFLGLALLLFSCRSQEETTYAAEAESRPVRNEQPPQNGQNREEVELSDGDTMLLRLENFLRFEQNIPAMALTAEQKGNILPVLQEWKDQVDSGKMPDEAALVGQIAEQLTAEQNRYEPFSQESGQSGPPSGGQGGGPQGPPPGQSDQSGQDGPPSGGPGGEISDSQRLEMLIRAFSGEPMMGPPPSEPPGESN